jgi:hypothetical protein
VPVISERFSQCGRLLAIFSAKLNFRLTCERYTVAIIVRWAPLIGAPAAKFALPRKCSIHATVQLSRLEAQCAPQPINAVPDTPNGPRSDGRTNASKRFRQLCEAFTAELGGQLSEVDQKLVKQAANLVLAAERFQLDVVNGATVDPDALVRGSSEGGQKNKPAGSHAR